MKQLIFFKLTALVVATIVGCGAGNVWANDQALEEIVVTARKQAESLQDVPIAVSAFGGADLANLGIEDITDLQQRLPNTTLQVSRGTNTT